MAVVTFTLLLLGLALAFHQVDDCKLVLVTELRLDVLRTNKDHFLFPKRIIVGGGVLVMDLARKTF